MICPTCGGEGKLIPVFARFAGKPTEDQLARLGDWDCSTCAGTGQITQEQSEAIEQGTRLRKLRLAKILGLRHCSELIGVLPSELANAEMGRTSAEDRTRLFHLIEALTKEQVNAR